MGEALPMWQKERKGKERKERREQQRRASDGGGKEEVSRFEKKKVELP